MASNHPLPHLLHLQASGTLQPTIIRQRVVSWITSQLSLSHLSELDSKQHTSGITTIDTDREEGRYVLAGAADGSLYVHDVGIRQTSSEVALHVGRSSKNCHTHRVGTVSWGADSGLFISSARDGLVKVWDTNTGRPVEQFSVGNVANKHALSDPEVGALVGVANDTSHVTLLDLRTGSPSHVLRGHMSEVMTLAWSLASPHVLATGGRDCKVNLWDVRQARSHLQTLDYNNVRYKKDLKLAGVSHQAGVFGLCFSGCGRYLLSLGQDKRVRRWDVVTGKNMKTKYQEVSTSCKHAVNIACSAGGETDFLFVPEKDKVLAMDIATGQTTQSLTGHFGSVSALSFNQCRLELYTGGNDRNVLVFEGQTSRTSAWLEHRRGQTDKTVTADTWSSEED